MRSQQAKPSRERGIVCGNHPAFAGGDVFVSEETEASGCPKAPTCASCKLRAWRVSRVFNDSKPMRLGERAESIHIGGDAGVMYRKNRFRAGRDPRRSVISGDRRIFRAADVDKNRRAATM